MQNPKQVIILEGMLGKQRSILSGWVERYYYITYSNGSYKLQYKSKSTDKSYKGELLLSGFDVQLYEPSSESEQFCFMLETVDKILVLRASSAKERSRWVGQLTLLKHWSVLITKATGESSGDIVPVQGGSGLLRDAPSDLACAYCHVVTPPGLDSYQCQRCRQIFCFRPTCIDVNYHGRVICTLCQNDSRRAAEPSSSSRPGNGAGRIDRVVPATTAVAPPLVGNDSTQLSHGDALSLNPVEIQQGSEKIGAQAPSTLYTARDQIVLTVVRAVNLKSTDLRSNCHSYCQIKVEGSTRRSAVIHGTTQPIYNFQCALPIYRHTPSFTVQIYHHDLFGSHRLLGITKIPIQHLEKLRVYESWFFLTTPSGTGEGQRGKVLLRMTRTGDGVLQPLDIAQIRLNDVLHELELSQTWSFIGRLVSFKSPVMTFVYYIIFCLLVLHLPADYIASFIPFLYLTVILASLLEHLIVYLGDKKARLLLAYHVASRQRRTQWAEHSVRVEQQIHQMNVIRDRYGRVLYNPLRETSRERIAYVSSGLESQLKRDGTPSSPDPNLQLDSHGNVQLGDTRLVIPHHYLKKFQLEQEDQRHQIRLAQQYQAIHTLQTQRADIQLHTERLALQNQNAELNQRLMQQARHGPYPHDKGRDYDRDHRKSSRGTPDDHSNGHGDGDDDMRPYHASTSGHHHFDPLHPNYAGNDDSDDDGNLSSHDLLPGEDHETMPAQQHQGLGLDHQHHISRHRRGASSGRIAALRDRDGQLPTTQMRVPMTTSGAVNPPWRPPTHGVQHTTTSKTPQHIRKPTPGDPRELFPSLDAGVATATTMGASERHPTEQLPDDAPGYDEGVDPISSPQRSVFLKSPSSTHPPPSPHGSQPHDPQDPIQHSEAFVQPLAVPPATAAGPSMTGDQHTNPPARYPPRHGQGGDVGLTLSALLRPPQLDRPHTGATATGSHTESIGGGGGAAGDRSFSLLPLRPGTALSINPNYEHPLHPQDPQAVDPHKTGDVPHSPIPTQTKVLMTPYVIPHPSHHPPQYNTQHQYLYPPQTPSHSALHLSPSTVSSRLPLEQQQQQQLMDTSFSLSSRPSAHDQFLYGGGGSSSSSFTAGPGADDSFSQHDFESLTRIPTLPYHPAMQQTPSGEAYHQHQSFQSHHGHDPFGEQHRQGEHQSAGEQSDPDRMEDYLSWTEEHLHLAWSFLAHAIGYSCHRTVSLANEFLRRTFPEIHSLWREYFEEAKAIWSNTEAIDDEEVNLDHSLYKQLQAERGMAESLDGHHQQPYAAGAIATGVGTNVEPGVGVSGGTDTSSSRPSTAHQSGALLRPASARPYSALQEKSALGADGEYAYHTSGLNHPGRKQGTPDGAISGDDDDDGSQSEHDDENDNDDDDDISDGDMYDDPSTMDDSVYTDGEHHLEHHSDGVQQMDLSTDPMYSDEGHNGISLSTRKAQPNEGLGRRTANEMLAQSYATCNNLRHVLTELQSLKGKSHSVSDPNDEKYSSSDDPAHSEVSRSASQGGFQHPSTAASSARHRRMDSLQPHSRSKPSHGGERRRGDDVSPSGVQIDSNLRSPRQPNPSSSLHESTHTTHAQSQMKADPTATTTATTSAPASASAAMTPHIELSRAGRHQSKQSHHDKDDKQGLSALLFPSRKRSPSALSRSVAPAAVADHGDTRHHEYTPPSRNAHAVDDPDSTLHAAPPPEDIKFSFEKHSALVGGAQPMTESSAAQHKQAQQAIQTHPFPSKKRHLTELFTLVLILETISSLFFRRQSQQHAISSHISALKWALFWLILSIVLPTRLIIILFATHLFVKRVRSLRNTSKR